VGYQPMRDGLVGTLGHRRQPLRIPRESMGCPAQVRHMNVGTANCRTHRVQERLYDTPTSLFADPAYQRIIRHLQFPVTLHNRLHRQHAVSVAVEVGRPERP